MGLGYKKIAYLVSEDISVDSGVVQKISSQIRHWKKEGFNIRVFSLGSTGGTSKISNGVAYAFPHPCSFLKTYLVYFDNINRLRKDLSEYQPDLIYSRYLLYSPNLLSVPRKYPPYIIEINADDINEYKIGNKWLFIFNLLTRNMLLKMADGFIFVTKELSETRSYQQYNKYSAVISNGIEVRDYQPFKKVNNNSIPHLVFIGSSTKPRQGIDKFLYMASLWQDFHFVIIGPEKEDLCQIDKHVLELPNLSIHGYLSKEESARVMASCDIGVSTLAFHRTKLNEACPLKTRQYMAQGLPVILGYEDVDLLNGDLNFVLHIGNSENNVRDNISVIRDFVLKTYKMSPDKIVAYAADHLDCSIKERKRLEYLECISEKSKKETYSSLVHRR